MASGIDWFRWHHGSVTDPKFQLVARKANARFGDVITVWAFLLEKASAAPNRGDIGELDYETLDFLLGAEEGTAARIVEAMTERRLVVAGRIAKWEERQPKREREDDTAAERKRRQREREEAASRHGAQDISAFGEGGDVTPPGDTSRHVTPRHATSHQKTPREEERREEESKESSSSLRSEEERARKRALPPPCPEDVDRQVWADWLDLRRAKKAPVTSTVLDAARREAVKAGMTLEAFLRVWCARGSQGLQADWLIPAQRASPAAINRQEAIEQRNRAVGDEWLREQEAMDAAR